MSNEIWMLATSTHAISSTVIKHYFGSFENVNMIKVNIRDFRTDVLLAGQ